MQAVIATLCDEVHVRDNGLMDIVGAGHESVGVTGLPWEGVLPFALMLQFEATDDRTDLGLGVRVVRASDGARVGGVEGGVTTYQRTAELLEGAPPYIPLALDVNVTLEAEGQHAVVVNGRNGERLAFVVFVVHLKS